MQAAVSLKTPPLQILIALVDLFGGIVMLLVERRRLLLHPEDVVDRSLLQRAVDVVTLRTAAKALSGWERIEDQVAIVTIPADLLNVWGVI